MSKSYIPAQKKKNRNRSENKKKKKRARGRSLLAYILRILYLRRLPPQPIELNFILYFHFQIQLLSIWFNLERLGWFHVELFACSCPYSFMVVMRHSKHIEWQEWFSGFTRSFVPLLRLMNNKYSINGILCARRHFYLLFVSSSHQA